MKTSLYSRTSKKNALSKFNSIRALLISAGIIASSGFLLSYSVNAVASCPGTLTVGANTGAVTDNGGTCAITISTGVTATKVDLNGAGSSLVNNGSIAANPYDYAVGIQGTNLNITNTGTIIGTTYSTIIFWSPGSVSNFINSGTIGDINSQSPITLNSGTRIDNFVNSGTIVGDASFFYAPTINNNGGTITKITNTGSISNASNGIDNVTASSVITTLNNLQGGSTPLLYRHYLPSEYNIIVRSPSQYGKIDFPIINGNTMTFGIYSGGVTGVSASTLAVGRYASVLTSIGAQSLSSILTGTYGTYNWALQDMGSSTWDLVVTCTVGSGCTNPGGGSGGGSSGGGSSSSSSSSTSNTPAASNIASGVRATIAGLGSTYNPVLSGGTLILSSGDKLLTAIAVTNSGGVIQHPVAGSAILSNVFSGAGSLTFTGTGTTVMSGNNSYSGGTAVTSGVLSVAGNSPTGYGDVNVSTGATLMGTGTINGNLIVAGILKPGNSPGYLASTGNVTMNAGSTYQQDIAGTTQASNSTPVGASGYYSYLNVTGGKFVINPGATLAPRLANLFMSNESGYGSAPYLPVLGDRFHIITADGGVSGKFSSVTQPAELTAGTQFLPFYNMADSNSLDLAVIPTSYKTTIASSSGNKNAQSVGGALDRMVVAAQSGTSTAAQDQLLYATSGKNAASLGNYAQGLSGEVYPAAVAVIAQTTQRVQQSVLSRLGDTMGLGLPSSMTSPTGNTGLMSTTNTALAGGVASSAVSTNPGVNPNADAKSFSNGNVWGDLAYQYGNRSSDSNSGGWNSNLYQLVFGSDFFTSNGMKIGGGLALSSTTLNPTYGSGTIQQGSLFAYGKMPVEEFVVDAMASFGLNNSDLSRGDGSGLTSGFRSKSISGNDAMVSLGLSRPFDTDSVRITPFARVTWQIVTQNGVNEGGAASALSVKSFTGNGVRGMLGVAAGSKVNDPMTEQYTYRAYVGVGADSSGVLNPSMTASLAGLSTNINTPNAGTTFVQAGLYGTAKFADNAYAYAGLSGEARSGQTLGTVNAGVRLQF